MKSQRYMAAVLLGGLLSGLALAADTGAWMLSYENKSTNQLVWDKRMAPMLRTHLPAALSDRVDRALGGPPEPVLVAAARYVSASACVPHDCSVKGFFWIDTLTGTSLGASANGADVRLGSNSLRAGAIPAPARSALLDWIDDNAIAPREVIFVGVDNTETSLDVADFQPRPHFTPPEAGPGFDCTAARTPVEQTICANPALAQTDLAMQRRFTQGQRGYDTVPSRNERRALQLAWLKERDRSCTDAADRVACLENSYAAQARRLDNWLPSR